MVQQSVDCSSLDCWASVAGGFFHPFVIEVHVRCSAAGQAIIDPALQWS